MDMKQLTELFAGAQKAQQHMQERLSQLEITAEAGGGMVRATMNGQFEVIGLHIDDALFQVEQKQMLLDLLRAALTEAARRVRDAMQSDVKNLLGGLGVS